MDLAEKPGSSVPRIRLLLYLSPDKMNRAATTSLSVATTWQHIDLPSDQHSCWSPSSRDTAAAAAANDDDKHQEQSAANLAAFFTPSSIVYSGPSASRQADVVPAHRQYHTQNRRANVIYMTLCLQRAQW